MSKIRQLLAMQEILDTLGKDAIRQQFVSGVNGTVVKLLTFAFL